MKNKSLLFFFATLLFIGQREHLAANESLRSVDFFTKRLEQVNHIPTTISIAYRIESSNDNGNKWKLVSEHVLKRDKNKKMYYFSEIKKQESISSNSEYFFANGESTWITTQKIGVKEHSIEINHVSARIRKGQPSLDDRHERLLQYNVLHPDMPLWLDNKATSRNMECSLISHNGIPALQITSMNQPKDNFLKFVFIFDRTNGRLLFRELFSCNKKAGGELQTRSIEKVSYSEYFFSNGVSFPSTIIFEYPNNKKNRYTIDKEKTKINDIISLSDFTAILPPNCEVRDEIHGKIYRTPVIGNTGAEKKAVTELENLFEKSKK
jgi:hypothetical protein